MPQNALTSRDYWSNHKPGIRSGNVSFDPYKPIFRAHHHLFRRLLPRGEGLTLLEVGCHPGQYLWYFNSQLGYEVRGIEYVPTFADETRRNLEASGVPAEIDQADLFEFAARGYQFDVVASFGFIEHFVDIGPALRAHWAMVRHGGYLVISVPNHAGLPGTILERVEPDVSSHHNHMGLAALEERLPRLDGAAIVACQHLGGIGFWNSGLYPLLRRHFPRTHRLLSAPFKVAEYLGRFVPESSRLSPNLVAIVRKDAS